MSAEPQTKKARRAAATSQEDDDMKPLGCPQPRTGLAFRMMHQKNNNGDGDEGGDGKPSITSLQEICRHTICAHLEKYHPESIAACLDEDEWNGLVQLRHEKTKPKAGSGGLDGTGRMAPALPEKCLSAIEAAHPDEKVRTSEIADQLFWKDLVNHSFRRGGLTRPRMLLEPWPLMVEHVQQAVQDATQQDAGGCRELEQLPMSVALLLATGAGKSLKKAVKRLEKGGATEQVRRLQSLLNKWKDLAQQEGVQVSSSSSSKRKPPPGAAAKSPPDNSISGHTLSHPDDAKDWARAEKCHSWRELYAALRDRAADLQSEQGRRMRQIRKNLSADRPQVVKVRPKSERALNGGSKFGSSVLGSSSSGSGTAKLALLKREAQISTARQNRGSDSANAAAVKRLTGVGAGPGSSIFSMAVAGAAGAKKGGGKKRKSTLTQHAILTSMNRRSAAPRGRLSQPPPSSAQRKPPPPSRK